MAINIVETKGAASMRLLVDSETEASCSIPNVAVDPDKNKLWALADAINQCQEHSLTRVVLTRTFNIDEE